MIGSKSIDYVTVKASLLGEKSSGLVNPVLYFLQRTEYYLLNRREIRSNSNVIHVKKKNLGCYL